MSKQDKRALELPSRWDKKTISARDITDAVKTYMGHRATEYYAILPYLYYTLDSFDPKTGLYEEPPRKATGYHEVPCREHKTRV